MSTSTSTTSPKSSVRLSSLVLITLIKDKAPRSRSKKQRLYEHVDLTKEFEMRYKKREAQKKHMLEELYERHDKKALEMKDVIATGKIEKDEEGSADLK